MSVGDAAGRGRRGPRPARGRCRCRRTEDRPCRGHVGRRPERRRRGHGAGVGLAQAVRGDAGRCRPRSGRADREQHVEEAVVLEAGRRVGVPDGVVQPGGALERDARARRRPASVAGQLRLRTGTARPRTPPVRSLARYRVPARTSSTSSRADVRGSSTAAGTVAGRTASSVRTASAGRGGVGDDGHLDGGQREPRVVLALAARRPAGRRPPRSARRRTPGRPPRCCGQLVEPGRGDDERPDEVAEPRGAARRWAGTASAIGRVAGREQRRVVEEPGRRAARHADGPRPDQVQAYLPSSLARAGLAEVERAEGVDHDGELVEVLRAERALDGAGLRAVASGRRGAARSSPCRCRSPCGPRSRRRRRT